MRVPSFFLKASMLDYKFLLSVLAIWMFVVLSSSYLLLSKNGFYQQFNKGFAANEVVPTTTKVNYKIDKTNTYALVEFNKKIMLTKFVPLSTANSAGEKINNRPSIIKLNNRNKPKPIQNDGFSIKPLPNQ